MEVSNEVIVERIENVRSMMNEKFEENNHNHEKMLSQLLYTNGKVRSLVVWRAYITGGVAVLSFVVGVFGVLFVSKLF